MRVMPDNNKDDPCEAGNWEPIKYKFNFLPVLVALLHTGNVLVFGGSGNDPKYLTSPNPVNNTKKN
jgi:hypothetical protein